MKIHSDFSSANIDEIKEIYSSVGWKKHNKELISKVFKASNVIALVEVNERIVGFGRAISDGAFNAAIYDVVVHPDFQNQGIAKKIIQFILEDLKDISCVHLISTTGNEELYRKCGFSKVKTGMARYKNPKLASEYLDLQ